MDELERDVADFVRRKYHLTVSEIDALTDEEYDELCDKAVTDGEWADRELFKVYQMRQNQNAFIDWILSHRP